MQVGAIWPRRIDVEHVATRRLAAAPDLVLTDQSGQRMHDRALAMEHATSGQFGQDAGGSSTARGHQPGRRGCLARRGWGRTWADRALTGL